MRPPGVQCDCVPLIRWQPRPELYPIDTAILTRRLIAGDSHGASRTLDDRVTPLTSAMIGNNLPPPSSLPLGDNVAGTNNGGN